MDPQGPSQPSQDTAYKTPGNVASTNPAEQNVKEHSHPHGQRLEDRLPTGGQSGSSAKQQGGAPQPSSLGYGVRGAPAGEESRGLTEEDVGRHKELEGESMVAGAGEGRVAGAVERKSGATGAEPDLTANLDRKKAEQAEKREAIKEGRKHGNYTEGIDPRFGGNESLRDA
ncbi:hypothetical protein PG993_011336 [Apiospora rasikravindrae]|uniref:Uncharacterized protein n=1 Tax=Apiospora rasikravindrae TaxID=990691 RepID=A0ABR1SF74_9PEZI